jgi:hypothetical protein
MIRHRAPRPLRPLPLLALGLLGLGLACAGEAPLEERVAKRVASAHPGTEVEVVGPDELTVTDADGETVTMFLGNLRLGCEDDPSGCDALIELRVSTLLEHKQQADPTPAQLRPALKGAVYLAEADALTSREGDPELAAANRLLRKPFLGDVYVVWVVDSPNTMAMVNQGTLEELGMSQEALEAKALDNFAACCGELPVAPVEDAPGLFQVWVGDSYEASRLLLHDRWAPLVATVPGDLVVAAPSREALLFTGSEDSGGLYLLSQLAQGISEGAYGLSPQLYLWTPETWKLVDIEEIPEGE